ncbi:MAG: hypothetical protein JWQ49_101 [Edaphobacter sp.]|nr:hypothetical protein [Edaphobacter sp.]
MANNLNSAYAAYRQAPNDSTLGVLLTEVTKHALRLARRNSNLDAEDIAQQTTIAVWQALPTYTDKAAMTTFVTTIVGHKVKDALRQRYSEPKLAPMQSWEVDVHQPDAAPPTRSITINVFDYLPTTLSESDKALIASMTSDKQRTEIAADMGISLRALRSRLSRLKQKIIAQ